MKYILEIVLTTIIIFFVWNILKKIFFNKFYKYTGFKPKERTPKQETKNANIEKKVKWDAETVDFEEVKENKK
ncbi:hypothetical protein [Chryseobacterium caseinilyticum]|uniref:AraC family transcriptional regulator n=1 Tax=Chryseobacterium caseinilyticum TaxID=2771428 RepID=A0ABR8Z9X1_9FLAO|nr:hypothetical protein [Chryseobacterium caseinilyticum]MBD8082097.1 hypothetical protein [Chryseobacterium caseinilyticum]